MAGPCASPPSLAVPPKGPAARGWTAGDETGRGDTWFNGPAVVEPLGLAPPTVYADTGAVPP